MTKGLPPYDSKTDFLHLPLPHEKNELQEDLVRVGTSLTMLDQHALSQSNRLEALQVSVSKDMHAALASETRDRKEADAAFLSQVQSIEAWWNNSLRAENTGRINADDRLAGLIAQETSNRDSADAAHSLLSLSEGVHGFPMGQEGQTLVVQGGKLTWVDRYFLCRSPYYFLGETPDPGFVPMWGTIIENAEDVYPAAWNYLLSDKGQFLCVTEEKWQALNNFVFHVNADGSKVGFDGIGGAPKFVVDTKRKTIRMPDVRGMYAEAAGFDSLGVGEAHGDGVRDITGSVNPFDWAGNYGQDNGKGALASVISTLTNGRGCSGGTTVSGSSYKRDTILDISRVVATANKVQPRAYGVLACVFLGPKNTQGSTP